MAFDLTAGDRGLRGRDLRAKRHCAHATWVEATASKRGAKCPFRVLAVWKLLATLEIAQNDRIFVISDRDEPWKSISASLSATNTTNTTNFSRFHAARIMNYPSWPRGRQSGRQAKTDIRAWRSAIER